MSNFKMQPVRGTRDIYGVECEKFNAIVNKARILSDLYNFSEISLPIFEFSDIFHRTLGQTSDVVSKETYTFLDRDGTSITLRPEFTAGIVRSVIHSGLTQSMPIKYFSYGPVFRHERPQKARYRQFHQINFESLGNAEVTNDIELLMLAEDLLKALGLRSGVLLEISSLGSAESRMEYSKSLVDYLMKYEADLSADSKVRMHKNPIRILDSKDSQDRRILEEAPSIFSTFDAESRSRFDALQAGLDEMNIAYTINPQLVRGLDYYTHTVFEYTTTQLGSQATVLAGGRYDGLFSLMGGDHVPGIGFAAGIERLAELITEDHIAPKTKLVALIPIGDMAVLSIPTISQKLRLQGYRVDYIIHHNTRKQMQKANKMQADYVLVFGEDELRTQSFKMKDMLTGAEELITL
jgi:histidyl-tRNA synthetase